MCMSLGQPTPSSNDTLDGITHAFFSSLDRDGGPIVQVLAVALLGAFAVLLVRWLRRENRRERLERELLDERHAAVSLQPPAPERREWMRVAAHLPISILHPEGHRGPFFEDCETQNVSGGGLSFLTHAPSPRGTPLSFTLNLGEKRPLSLRGVVTRTEPPTAPGAPHLVALQLGPIAVTDRERIVRWVTHEESRELAEARRGRLCSVCKRPLADPSREVHSACASAAAKDASKKTDAAPGGPPLSVRRG
jgi:hypothetical protein